MRLCISIRLVAALGCAIAAASASPVMAEEARRVSTIRLTSATERVTKESQGPRLEHQLLPAPPADAPQPPLNPPKTAPSAPVTQSAFSRPTLTTTQATPPTAPQMSNPLRHAIDFYGARAASERMNQMPQRVAMQSRPGQPANPSRGKPFQTLRSAPTVSPYLNLAREERDSQTLPNYFAFVRPQLEQIEANRQQQQELQQLRGQLQGAATAAVAPQRGGASRGPARYMDTGQFYQGLR